MDQLWAPWRLAYVQSGEKDKPLPIEGLPFLEGADRNCFICQAVADEAHHRQRYVVSEGEHTITILNRFPYNNGHTLVAPKRHVGELKDLTQEELTGLMLEVSRIIEKLKAAVNPDAFNVGFNLGQVAGAGLPGHLHCHIVPRWNGDTNFMPVLTDVKVIPQSLDALWELLK